MRKEFLYKGTQVFFKEIRDGWRYYESEDKTIYIRCKGLEVEELQHGNN